MSTHVLWLDQLEGLKLVILFCYGNENWKNDPELKATLYKTGEALVVRDNKQAAIILLFKSGGRVDFRSIAIRMVVNWMLIDWVLRGSVHAPRGCEAYAGLRHGLIAANAKVIQRPLHSQVWMTWRQTLQVKLRAVSNWHEVLMLRSLLNLERLLEHPIRPLLGLRKGPVTVSVECKKLELHSGRVTLPNSKINLTYSSCRYAKSWLLVLFHFFDGRLFQASRSPTILPADVPIEEERIPGYDPKRFLPLNPGDLLNNRYKIIVKVGWGTTSTVWLAQDTQCWWWSSNRYVTVKVTASDCVDDDAAKHERIMTRHLKRNPSHEGFSFMRTMLDNFEAPGQDGPHLCLVYEPMREPLWLFQRRWENGKLPPALLKVYLRFLLRGLDYLHSECHIIHTDLKLDNILLGFEHPSVIEDFVQKQSENPMPRKIKDGRSIYLSHNDFGPPKSFRILPKIADFGLAQSGEGAEPLMHPIQPPLFHAPEVLLGTSWTYSAEIWNLGVLLWNMMEGRDLFTHIRSSQGDYDVRAHIAEMIALLGTPPKILVGREVSWSKVKWSHAVPNSEGKLCQTAREYYGGPFFNSVGQFMHMDLIPTGVSLEGCVFSLKGEDKGLFLDFIKKMLQWLPEDRKTAKELLEDSWLQEKST